MGSRALSVEMLPAATGDVPAGQDVRGNTLVRLVVTARRRKQLLLDVAVVLLAVLDVALHPPTAEIYEFVFSWVACAALLARRRFPRTVLLLTLPGMLAGWSLIAGMVAMYCVAKKHRLSWQTTVCGALLLTGYFVVWPLNKFVEKDVSWLILHFIYAGLIAIAPTALALLTRTYRELSDRIVELGLSREREKALDAQAVRTEERARLAREMHDVVSHQVSLIAMQAGALQVTTEDDSSREIAVTIRQLSTRTLEELRGLVSLLRTAEVGDAAPTLGDLGMLIGNCGMKVTTSVELPEEGLPPSISGAAYRTVQEALTNVRKHAPEAATEVRITADEGSLHVEVHNARTRRLAASLPSGGHGLMGLRERAVLLGGAFHAGPTPDGGFTVRVDLPLASRSAYDSVAGDV